MARDRRCKQLTVNSRLYICPACTQSFLVPVLAAANSNTSEKTDVLVLSSRVYNKGGLQCDVATQMKQLGGIDCNRLTMLFVVYNPALDEYGCHVLIDHGVVQENIPRYNRTSGGSGSYHGLSEDTETLAEEDEIVKALHEEGHEDDDDRAFIGDGDLEHHDAWGERDDEESMRAYCRRADLDAAHRDEERTEQELQRPRKDRAAVLQFHGIYSMDYDKGTARYGNATKKRVTAPSHMGEGAGPAGSYAPTQAGAGEQVQYEEGKPRFCVVRYDSNGEPVVVERRSVLHCLGQFE
jgi:hypothetical protein